MWIFPCENMPNTAPHGIQIYGIAMLQNESQIKHKMRITIKILIGLARSLVPHLHTSVEQKVDHQQNPPQAGLVFKTNQESGDSLGIPIEHYI